MTSSLATGLASLTVDYAEEPQTLSGLGTIPAAAGIIEHSLTMPSLSAAVMVPASSTISNNWITTLGIQQLGGVSPAVVVPSTSINPNSLSYFRRGEPLSRIAGHSITSGLDVFRAAEPFAGISQFMSVNVDVPGTPLPSAAVATFGSLLIDQVVSALATSGGGGLPGASASISLIVSATPSALVGTVSAALVGMGQSLTTAPLGGIGELGSIARLSDLHLPATTIQAAGTLCPALATATRPMQSNDLSTFKRAEPIRALAGLNSSAGLDMFRRSEPFSAVIGALQGTMTASATVTPLPSQSLLSSPGLSTSSTAPLPPFVATGRLGDVAGLALNSLTTPAAFALAGATVPASLFGDVRYQASGVGAIGAMGVPVFSNPLAESVLPLAASATFAGGLVHRPQGAKRYFPFRRHRVR
jgi:hypothetical protein